MQGPDSFDCPVKIFIKGFVNIDTLVRIKCIHWYIVELCHNINEKKSLSNFHMESSNTQDQFSFNNQLNTLVSKGNINFNAESDSKSLESELHE